MCILHSQVQQSAMLVPMEQMAAQLIHILADHRASDPNHKVTYQNGPHAQTYVITLYLRYACLARPDHVHDNICAPRIVSSKPHIGKACTLSGQAF